MREVIYGDIHGCLDEFKALRSELDLQDKDREISVGDLLDRGPLSNEVLSYARENDIELVLGNHEHKYIRYKKHHEAFLQTGKKNPMFFNESKMNIFENISKEDMSYLEASPMYIKIDKLTILHAGVTNKLTALVIHDTKEPMLNYDIVQVDAKMTYVQKQ